MAQAQERPRITEIQVRIDCNGCVQKIKKALQGIDGISDAYIDLPQQKLTIVGWANPEKIIKAIKKARKNATIYSHSEVQEPPPTHPTDQTPPDSEAAQPPEQPEPPKDQPTLPSEPPKDQVPPPPPENSTTHEPPPPENQTHEPPPPPVNPNEARHHQHKEAVEEVHVIHHHTADYRYRPGYSPGYNPGPTGYTQGHDPDYSPEHHRYSQRHGPGYNPGPPQGYDPDYSPDPPRHSQRHGPVYNPGPPGHNQGYGPSYRPGSPGYGQGCDYEPGYNPGSPDHSHSHGYGGYWSGRPESSYRPERPQGPQPIHVTHSYNQYKPQPNVTQYEYVQSPPPRFTPYARTESYYYYNNGDYQYDYNNNNNYTNNGYVSSMFSEENPNACTIS